MNSELDKRLKEEDKEGLNQLVKAHQTKIFSEPRPLFQVSQAEQIKQDREEGSKEEKAKNEDEMEAEESAS